MKKIKVCHFSTVHSINDNRILHKECCSLASHGFDVTYVAFGKTSFEDIKNEVKRVSLHLPVSSRFQRLFKRSSVIYKKIKKINADIYHFHDPELLPIGLRLKKNGKKVIFDSHEFYVEQIKSKTYIPLFLRKIIASLYKHYETYVCKRIDAVIQVCTLEGANYFENRAKRTVLIANSPKLKKLNGGLREYGGRDAAIYVGSLTANRGITNIIKASFKANTPLILGGNFHSVEYERVVSDFVEFRNVDFKGYINEEEVADLLNRAFAGLATLLHVNQYNKIDTLPTKVYDYMAAGIPIIMSNTTYAENINKRFNIGICVDPANIDQIADAIHYLSENRDIAQQLGLNGRRAFEKYFNWQVEESKLIHLYRTL